MKRLISFLDPILVVGVVFSVLLTAFLVAIEQDTVTSLLIGLVATAISLMIDLIARQQLSEKRIVQSFALGDSIAQDPELFPLLRQITDDYLRVKEGKFRAFTRRAHSALLECHDTLHLLAEGRMTVPIASRHKYGRTELTRAKKSVKAVAFADMSYWKTANGQGFFRSNVEVVRRGPEFTRIWLQSRKTLESHIDVLQTQMKAGIQVYYAFPESVPPELVRDYTIIDDSVLIALELATDGTKRAVAQTVSVDAADVERAIAEFEILFRHASRFSGEIE